MNFRQLMEREFSVLWNKGELPLLKAHYRIDSRRAVFLGMKRNHYGDLISGVRCGERRARHLASKFRSSPDEIETLTNEIMEASRQKPSNSDELPEIMLPEELASILRVSCDDIVAALTSGEIPGAIKIHGEIRALKAVVSDWLWRQAEALASSVSAPKTALRRRKKSSPQQQ